jgi:hypothetical protein
LAGTGFFCCDGQNLSLPPRSGEGDRPVLLAHMKKIS